MIELASRSIVTPILQICYASENFFLKFLLESAVKVAEDEEEDPMPLRFCGSKDVVEKSVALSE